MGTSFPTNLNCRGLFIQDQQTSSEVQAQYFAQENFKKEYDPVTLKYIGSGSYGKVFSCIRRSDYQRVAIKIIVAKQQEQLFYQQEIKNLLLVSHENVIKMLDFKFLAFQDSTGEVLTEFIIIQEYADSSSLDFILLQEKYLSQLELIKLFKDCCNGLLAIHNQGKMIHGDLKPENILAFQDLVDRENQRKYKISDVGGSLIIRQLKDKNDASKNGTELTKKQFSFTKLYVAPEVARFLEGGPDFITQSADIFSLGLTFLQALGAQQSQIQRINNKIYSVILARNEEVEEELDRYVNEVQQILKEQSRFFCDEIIELIEQMLNFDPNLRISLDRVIKESQHIQTILITQDSNYQQQFFNNQMAYLNTCRPEAEFNQFIYQQFTTNGDQINNIKSHASPSMKENNIQLNQSQQLTNSQNFNYQVQQQQIIQNINSQQFNQYQDVSNNITMNSLQVIYIQNFIIFLVIFFLIFLKKIKKQKQQDLLNNIVANKNSQQYIIYKN